MDPYEREEQDIDERAEAGHITPAQARAEHLELQRGCRDDAEEAAQQAYDNELRNW